MERQKTERRNTENAQIQISNPPPSPQHTTYTPPHTLLAQPFMDLDFAHTLPPNYHDLDTSDPRTWTIE